ncbi:type II secretion system protein N [Alcanivorax sp. JB21]|uniref:type II secretion system protein N n=1 Tax=Alcanivorax limicola TaxID=2874102 RepID=UPI001CBC9526|nr:type II secretion system protein N [Alcanivorax limicola]MBZ2187491.1 type II secretion system protein N [Alcanivorax limicola]
MTVSERVLLSAVFLVSLCGFLLAGIPAATVLSPLLTMDAESERPIITRVQGVWWDGAVQGRWREHHFLARWRLERRGLSPGVRLSIDAGGFDASGWAGRGSRDWRLEQWLVTLPVMLVEDLLPDVSADGIFEIDIEALALSNSTLKHVDGKLRYGGGKVSWRELESVSVPALDGVLGMVEGRPEFSMAGPAGETLMQARLGQDEVSLRIYTALLQLFGMTEDGDPASEIFHNTYAFPH